jgi:hypothetical protein
MECCARQKEGRKAGAGCREMSRGIEGLFSSNMIGRESYFSKPWRDEQRERSKPKVPVAAQCDGKDGVAAGRLVKSGTPLLDERKQRPLNEPGYGVWSTRF